jgi:predicted PurR-regulated permease PerM
MDTSHPPTKTETEAAAAGWARPAALAVLTLALVVLCVVLAVPLLPALAWGAALAIIGWPLHNWLSRYLGRPGLAAFLTTLVVTGIVLGAGLFVTYHIAREATAMAERGKDRPAGEAVRDTMAQSAGLSGVVDWMDRVGVDLDRQVRALVEPYTQDVAGLAGGSVKAVLQFAIAVFVLFNFLRDRGPLLEGLRRVLPMTRSEAERVFGRFADSVYANLYATLVTSLIDAVGGGLMFWALGLPSPVLWGVVMFVLSIVPLLGTWLVWVPAAGYLAATGRWPEALLLVGYGVASGFVVDNIIYVRVAGDRMRLHQVPTLVAFLGGLAVFGASGMILGPAALAVTVAVLDVWRRRYAEQEAPAPAAA